MYDLWLIWYDGTKIWRELALFLARKGQDGQIIGSYFHLIPPAMLLSYFVEMPREVIPSFRASEEKIYTQFGNHIRMGIVKDENVCEVERVCRDMPGPIILENQFP